MKSVRDQMTAEQRVRFDTHVARQLAKPPTTNTTCAYCDKFIADFQSPKAPTPEDLLAAGAVAVPNFGWFCSHSCADAYERDFGIRFQRDASGKVRYY
jgi:hypothetical protein